MTKKGTARLLQVGDIATVCIKPADKLWKTGDKRRFKVAECGGTETGSDPQEIGLEAPIIAGLIGQPVNEHITCMIGGTRSRISLKKIERP